MVKEPRPTRAEVNDAANAAADGADAVMLSGETAVGAYPLKAVRTLDRVLRDAECVPAMPVPLQEAHVPEPHGQAMCEAAVTLADHGHAAAIVAVTREGRTAGLLSSLRPATPIVAVTDQPAVARRLALSWGVVPLVVTLGDTADTVTNQVTALLAERQLIQAGSAVVVVSMAPGLSPGPSNFLKVQSV
jgi:pyruvate kinase